MEYEIYAYAKECLATWFRLWGQQPVRNWIHDGVYENVRCSIKDIDEAHEQRQSGM